MQVKSLKLMTVFATLLMSSCAKYDFYDELSVENETKKIYGENFVAKFPNVDMNQNWDYSTKAPSYGLLSDAAVEAKALTRVGSGNYGEGSFSTSGDWYEVDNETTNWMFSKLTENVNHSDLGKPFYMTTPGNDFTIVPIFQGRANAAFNFHVVIDDVDHEVWTKTADFEIKDDYNDWCLNNWTALSAAWEHDKWDVRGSHGDLVYNTMSGLRVKDNGEPITVTAVRSKKIEFKNIPAGKPMYFYLKIYNALNAGDNYCKTGDEQSSLAGAMIALTDAPIPANLQGKDAMIIGCEDAGRESSDWDYNDVAFLIYGEKKPEPVIIEGKPVKETVTVRYMIEDLGATDDFDFNDIVIDVATIKEKTPVYEDNKLSYWKDEKTYQKAIIRHLGGTLPFKLTIGNTELAEMGGNDTFQTSPNLEFDVTGYNFNEHNIRVMVKQRANENVYNNVKFPKAGEAPMIIAVNPDQEWMPERQIVPEDWFYVPGENK